MSVPRFSLHFPKWVWRKGDERLEYLAILPGSLSPWGIRSLRWHLWGQDSVLLPDVYVCVALTLPFLSSATNPNGLPSLPAVLYLPAPQHR